MKKANILAIESSCDETAICLLSVDSECKVDILHESLATQIDLHKQYGGVVPELAAREHIKALSLLIGKLYDQIPKVADVIDAIAVTTGPGLKGCLLMGVNAARGLSIAWNKPLLGINHIEGHVYSAFLENHTPKYPFLTLIVSGGHTELVLVKALGDYQILSKTIDDAAGEAFDKSAYLLGFDYPGGAGLAKLAQTVTKSQFKLPKSMRGKEDFSFSGLKTAISLLIKNNKDQVMANKAECCFAIQEAIVESLLDKVKVAISEYNVEQFCLVGGVAANQSLRQKISKLASDRKIEFCVPSFNHCTDNAAMIAIIAGLRFLHNEQSLSNYDLQVRPRWPLELK